ncbi:MAG: ankyrin repeat domain-containing protein [Opitutaceae bacterium]|nr:ankyrin repeat domain-containing protein [Opitutaceae bacterium]
MKLRLARGCALGLAIAWWLSGIARADTTVLLVAGEPSHGPGEHRFPDGCTLLASALNASGLPVRAEVSLGWPDDAKLAAASSIVLYSDGLDRHVAEGKVAQLRRHVGAKKGLAVLHFALEPSRGELSDFLLEAIGGRFEEGWSVNPVWKLEQPKLARHAVTRGVAPFALDDEWYYHLRFRSGATPVLQALAPGGTLGQDGPRSGNPAVRAALAKGEPQTLGWVFEAGGARTFGFTGGHYHRNWSDDNFRKLVLNGILWTAGLEVPPQGVSSKVAPMPRHPTIDEAIARGDLDDVRLHWSIDSKRIKKAPEAAMSPLHNAILRNRNEIAALLIEKGADVNEPDRSQRTPLHLAVERGNVALVETLLVQKAKPNERDRMGWTPLHHAAAKDKVAIARALLKGGANPMTLSERGGTPLHEAAASGGAEMIQLFLDRKVDPAVVSKLGVTALDIAREYKNEVAIKMLEPITPKKK